MNIWEAALVVWIVGGIWTMSLGVREPSKILLWPCWLVLTVIRGVRDW